LSRRLLYAAGEAAGSLYLIGVSKSVVMDRIAGEAAAAEKASVQLGTITYHATSGESGQFSTFRAVHKAATVG
jgi:hypothetical protein